MHITIYKHSTFVGLTTENLKLPAVQTLLRHQGITVTFPHSEYAVLKSENGAFFNSSFQQKVKEIEEQHKRNLAKETARAKSHTELNNYSWPVLNGFMVALSVSAVATALVVLSGASLVISASIGIGTGIAAGIGAMLTYGLFQRALEKEQDTPRQFIPSAV